jgi:uncharacterized protein (TIGR02246 family)
MTTPFARLLLLLLSVIISAQTGSAQGTQTAANDEQAIRQIVKQLEDGWNARDGKAFAAPFAEDADYVVVNGSKLRGKDAIGQGHANIFATIYKESHNSGTARSVRFLRPDVAVAHVEWNLEIAPGGENSKAISTLVLTKEAGKWSIAAFQNTPIRPAGR